MLRWSAVQTRPWTKASNKNCTSNTAHSAASRPLAGRLHSTYPMAPPLLRPRATGIMFTRHTRTSHSTWKYYLVHLVMLLGAPHRAPLYPVLHPLDVIPTALLNPLTVRKYCNENGTWPLSRMRTKRTLLVPSEVCEVVAAESPMQYCMQATRSVLAGRHACRTSSRWPFSSTRPLHGPSCRDGARDGPSFCRKRPP